MAGVKFTGYFHTGKYDLATDKFIGGGVRAYVTVPASDEWPIDRQIAVDGKDPDELENKLIAMGKLPAKHDEAVEIK